MVAPLIAAGARAAGGAAARRGAERATIARGAVPSATTRAAGGTASGFPAAQRAPSSIAQRVQETPDSFVQTFKAVFFPAWPVRVGNVTIFLIMLPVVICDAVQMIFPLFHVILPPFGTALGFFGPFLFGVVGLTITGMAFALCGVQFFSGKRALQKVAAVLGPIALEVAPLLSTIPALTSGAITTFVISRLEDRDRHEELEIRLAQARTIEAERTMQQQEAGQQLRARQQAIAEQNAAAISEDTDTPLETEQEGEDANTLVLRKKQSLPRGDYPTAAPIPDFAPPPPARRQDIAPSGWR